MAPASGSPSRDQTCKLSLVVRIFFSCLYAAAVVVVSHGRVFRSWNWLEIAAGVLSSPPGVADGIPAGCDGELPPQIIRT